MNVDPEFEKNELLTIDFIEFLFSKGNNQFKDDIRKKISVSKAIMRFTSLIEVNNIGLYWHSIPGMFDRFKFKIAESIKSQSYDTLKDLYEYKYSLRERELLFSGIIEQHKKLLNIEQQEKKPDEEKQKLITKNIDYNEYLIRYIEMALTYIDHQLNVFDKFSIETKQEQNVEKVVESKTILKKHKIKVDLNQFEFALLLNILKEQGVFTDYTEGTFSKNFAEFIIDNFLCYNSTLKTYEIPKSIYTIFSHVYKEEDRRRVPFKELYNDIEQAYLSLANKYLIDIQTIKFQRK